MKVRIGVSADNVDGFLELVDDCERLGIDSLWLSEIIAGPLPDPVVGMAAALARTSRLKVGTGVMVLPGRHPVHVAKQLVSLARIAPGRVLPAFGLKPARSPEAAFYPVPEGRRAALFDETLRALRLLVTEPEVSFHGEFFSLDGVTVGTLPDKPLDIWLGGRVPAAFERIGRLADGWLGSFVTPAEATAGIAHINRAAADAGRAVDPEHHGMSLGVVFGEVPDGFLADIARRRADVDPTTFFPRGWAAARARIEEFVAAGVSKFVVRPVLHPGGAAGFIEEFAAELLPLQT
jgi:probable F420-dependent oxidoreductase